MAHPFGQDCSSQFIGSGNTFRAGRDAGMLEKVDDWPLAFLRKASGEDWRVDGSGHLRGKNCLAARPRIKRGRARESIAGDHYHDYSCRLPIGNEQY
jgi:hypothetical protein